MQITKVNAIVGGVIAVSNAVIPFIVLIGLWHATPEAIGAGELVVTTVVTLGGLIFSGTPASNTPA